MAAMSYSYLHGGYTVPGILHCRLKMADSFKMATGCSAVQSHDACRSSLKIALWYGMDCSGYVHI